MTRRSKEIILNAMRNAKGDDLERARLFFGGNSETELSEQYGESGQTRREILAGYQEYRDEWETAWRELNEIL